jgi:hypothetical protein
MLAGSFGASVAVLLVVTVMMTTTCLFVVPTDGITLPGKESLAHLWMCCASSREE